MIGLPRRRGHLQSTLGAELGGITTRRTPTVIDLVLEPEEPVLDRSHHVCAGECALPIGAVDLGDSCTGIVDPLECPGAVANEPVTAGGVHINPDDLTVLAQRPS